MKKILLFTLVILLAGCGEKSLKEQINAKHSFRNQVTCNLNSDIVYANYNYIITKDNVYNFNIDKLFSNNENCKVKELPHEAISELGTIKGVGGYYWVCPDIISNSKIFQNTDGWCDKSNYNNFKVIDNPYEPLLQEKGISIIYSELRFPAIVSIDNQIKRVKIESKHILDEHGSWVFEDGEPIHEYYIKSIKDIETPFEENEEVLSVNNDYVKTNKAYYQVKKVKTNKEECEKYADIKCKYGYVLKKDNVLTKNYDSIIYAGEIIIDKDYNVYQLPKNK